MKLDIHAMPGHLVRRLHQRSTQVFLHGVRAAGFDITPVQFAALDALRGSPGMDQAKVAQLIAYDRATIGGVIERLEKRGLLRRNVNQKDRRARLVSLTKAGEDLIARLIPVVAGFQDDILGPLDPGERSTLCRLLEKSLEMTTGESARD